MVASRRAAEGVSPYGKDGALARLASLSEGLGCVAARPPQAP